MTKTAYLTAYKTTDLSRSNFKKIAKLAPRCTSVVDIDIKSEYRKCKSEFVAEMLFELWDMEPSEYDLESIVEEKWEHHIVPLMRLGLDKRVYSDKSFYYND